MNVLALGFAVWLTGLLLLPAPIAARILLLAPLVVVPGLLGRLPQRRVIGSLALADLGGLPALTAALPLLAGLRAPGRPHGGHPDRALACAGRADGSRRVWPAKALAAGYRFVRPRLEDSLTAALHGG